MMRSFALMSLALMATFAHATPVELPIDPISTATDEADLDLLHEIEAKHGKAKPGYDWAYCERGYCWVPAQHEEGPDPGARDGLYLMPKPSTQARR